MSTAKKDTYHYLIVLRRNLDDMPVKIMHQKAAAEKAASRITADDDKPLRKVLGVDESGPISVWVYEYLSGKPVDAWMVNEIDIDEKESEK